MIRDITGLNELVDGSTPDPRTLTTIANMANESSNNALGDVIVGDQSLYIALADGLYQRLQTAVKYGDITGYTKALGTTTVNFIKITSDISMHTYGIFATLSMTDIQKEQFKRELKEMATAGIINADDAVIVGNIPNRDQAEQVLAYFVKRTREQKQKEAIEQMKMNGEIQQKSAVVSEGAKQKTIALESQGKIKVEEVRGKNELEAIRLKYKLEFDNEGLRGDNDIKKEAAKTIGQIAVNKNMGQKNVIKQ